MPTSLGTWTFTRMPDGLHAIGVTTTTDACEVEVSFRVMGVVRANGMAAVHASCTCPHGAPGEARLEVAEEEWDAFFTALPLEMRAPEEGGEA